MASMILLLRTYLYALTVSALSTVAAALISPTTAKITSMHTFFIKGSNGETSVIQKDGAEEPVCCRKKTFRIQSSDDIDKYKESKQSLWRRIAGSILPGIHQAKARFEEYEAGIYRRIEEFTSDAGQVEGACEVLLGVGEKKTEKLKTNC
ncbi:hypothetical protein SNK04_011988 [Fusarium graminearum]